MQDKELAGQDILSVERWSDARLQQALRVLD